MAAFHKHNWCGPRGLYHGILPPLSAKYSEGDHILLLYFAQSSMGNNHSISEEHEQEAISDILCGETVEPLVLAVGCMAREGFCSIWAWLQLTSLHLESTSGLNSVLFLER